MITAFNKLCRASLANYNQLGWDCVGGDDLFALLKLWGYSLKDTRPFSSFSAIVY